MYIELSTVFVSEVLFAIIKESNLIDLFSRSRNDLMLFARWQTDDSLAVRKSSTSQLRIFRVICYQAYKESLKFEENSSINLGKSSVFMKYQSNHLGKIVEI